MMRKDEILDAKIDVFKLPCEDQTKPDVWIARCTRLEMTGRGAEAHDARDAIQAMMFRLLKNSIFEEPAE